jgi:quinolinate synthase
MSDVSASIGSVRKELGHRLLVLGHHYQRQEVLQHADVIGDSLELAKRAAAEKEAASIVFCGVHFMAESADILTDKAQTVYMPEPDAGCPMAEMASETQVRRAWDAINEWGGGDWLPVVYVNSSAAIKALCGEWGGSTCTSSNACKVFDWVLSQGKRVFFLPDEHLGVNTAHDLNIEQEYVRVFDPSSENGGLTIEQMTQTNILVWKGYCHVHTAFTVADVERVRNGHPDAKIIVHPETPAEVVSLCDAHGSTSQIIKYVEAAPDGETIFIGTEANLVQRLAQEHEGRVTIEMLSHSLCPNMYMTTEESLLTVLEAWLPANEIHVEEEIANRARSALKRMLTI